MTHSVEPDTGGFISGPMDETPESAQRKEDAFEALSAFAGTIKRDTANLLLSHWCRNKELTPTERVAILTRFPASKAYSRKRRAL